MRSKKEYFNFIIQKYQSVFETFELPGGIYEVGDIINIFINLIEKKIPLIFD